MNDNSSANMRRRSPSSERPDSSTPRPSQTPVSSKSSLAAARYEGWEIFSKIFPSFLETTYPRCRPAPLRHLAREFPPGRLDNLRKRTAWDCGRPAGLSSQVSSRLNKMLAAMRFMNRYNTAWKGAP